MFGPSARKRRRTRADRSTPWIRMAGDERDRRSVLELNFETRPPPPPRRKSSSETRRKPRKVPVGRLDSPAPLSTRNGLRVTMAAMMSSAMHTRCVSIPRCPPGRIARDVARDSGRGRYQNLNPEGPSAYRRRGRGFRIRAAGGAGEPLTPNATARSHTGCRRRTESAVSSRRAPISSRRRTHRLTSAAIVSAIAPAGSLPPLWARR